MGTVVLAGATSGSTTLTPVDAVTTTITLPSATGTLVYGLTGTYTPTITQLNGNITSSIARLAQYYRVNDRCTVSGVLTMTASVATTNQFRLTLPIATTFTTSYQLAGSGACDDNKAVFIYVNASNNTTAFFSYVASDTSAHEMTYTFTYQIL